MPGHRLEYAGPAPRPGAGVSTFGAQPTRSRVNAEFGGRRDVSRPPLPEALPVPVVDNHCHLDIEDGDSWLDPAAALER